MFFFGRRKARLESAVRLSAPLNLSHPIFTPISAVNKVLEVINPNITSGSQFVIGPPVLASASKLARDPANLHSYFRTLLD
jgi:hypothetical protein